MTANRKLLIGGAVVLGLVLVGSIAALVNSRLPGALGGIDERFGDQHLKTTVALVELHQRRHDRYPATLDDLRFTGEWDRIALTSTQYCTNVDGSAYYVRVERGWMGEPDLSMPERFWEGTGFSRSVGPCG